MQEHVRSIQGNEIENNYNLTGYLRIAKYCRYIKKEIIIKIILNILVTGTYVLQAILLAKGTAAVFAGEPFRIVLSFYSVVIFCIILRAILIKYLEGYTKLIAGKLKAKLREFVIDKLLRLGPGYQADKRSGRFQSLVTDGIEYLEPYLVNYIPQIFITVLSVFPLVIYIFTVDAAVGIILVVSTLLAVLLPHFLVSFYTNACVGYWQEYAILNSQYIDAMQGMNTLKVFNGSKKKGTELAKASECFRQRQLINTRYSLLTSNTIIFMIAVASSITIGIAAYKCSDGRITTNELLNIMFLVIECVRPIGILNDAWHSSNLGLSVASELLEILEEPITDNNCKNARKDGLEQGLPNIEFENVSFQYNNKREFALSNVSFSLDAGNSVAVVGESGSGKSTIVNLLLRFYDTKIGKIKINGVDIQDYDIEYLRSKISVVFQTTFLFYGTVRDNIRMAAPDATDEQIIEAAKASNAHEFIMSLPKQYDTIVGEKGENLSGGQRQRIAIARAILKDAPILIMDEATSNVDTENEKEIQETLEKLEGKFTRILIAHRLSTIRNAKQIYVFDKGHLTETGTHTELMKKRGSYYYLTKIQDGGEALAK